MPMGDMTGPAGQGPGTGRKMGKMAGNQMGMGQPTDRNNRRRAALARRLASINKLK